MGRAGRRLLLAGVICALALAAFGVHHAMRKRGLSPEQAARFAHLNGVWRSRGYGWLWVIGDGELRVFDESGPLLHRASRCRPEASRISTRASS